MNNNTPMSLMDFVRVAKTRIREVTPEQLQEMLDSQDDVLLVDVRESSEHEQGHIKGAMLVPRGILEAAADPTYPKHQMELSAARQRPVVLYCATGGRSAMAADTLQLMGFSNVCSLDGGFVRWAQENRPVIKEARYI
ncbi:MAG: rhodanese-like domain-containing protein [Thiogranum sp.]|jgi:rhodanese-related sulfurtransferase